MPRSLVLGNGNILVCIDKFGQLRDFYFHYVGLENQMYKGCVARIGVWIDNQFSSVTDSDWQILVDYKYETLVGNIVAVNHKLELELQFSDCVYNEKNIFLREVVVRNKAARERNIKVFLNHQFHLLENKVGDTGYFDPQDHTIVHYKGRRLVIIGGKHNDKSFTDYSIGVFGIEGKEGTWIDSFDGLLSKNPVEHGPVDSTIAFEQSVDANSEFVFYSWLCIDKTLHDVKALHKLVVEKTPEHIARTTADFWKAWVNKTDVELTGFTRPVVDLFKKSLLIMRTHFDNTGGILASGDSDMLQFGKDTYSYVWPRDAAFVSIAFDKAGYTEVAKRFFDFANQVISDDGYFYHKYRPDKSLGSSWHPWILDGQFSLPIQEDETALVLIALWNHYEATSDLEFIESVYNTLIKKAANFMLGFREGTTKLPLPTYDLWEMKNGISTFTASTVYAALLRASEFAHLLGKERDSGDYKRGAEEIKQGIATHLWNEEDSYFYKHINIKDGQVLHDKTIDASSFYGIFKFGVLPMDDPRMIRALKTLENRLVNKTAIGGVARFENDTYYQTSSDNISGNPWFNTTLWLAQYYIAQAKDVEDLQKAYKYLEWAVSHSLGSGILSEQLNPYTGEQVAASPLMWSHSEFVTTVIEYSQKLQQLNKQKPTT